MQKKKDFKELTFLPRYRISPVLDEYVSTYPALLKFSKRAPERCYSAPGQNKNIKSTIREAKAFFKNLT